MRCLSRRLVCSCLSVPDEGRPPANERSQHKTHKSNPQTGSKSIVIMSFFSPCTEINFSRSGHHSSDGFLIDIPWEHSPVELATFTIQSVTGCVIWRRLAHFCFKKVSRLLGRKLSVRDLVPQTNLAGTRVWGTYSLWLACCGGGIGGLAGGNAGGLAPGMEDAYCSRGSAGGIPLTFDGAGPYPGRWVEIYEDASCARKPLTKPPVGGLSGL